MDEPDAGEPLGGRRRVLLIHDFVDVNRPLEAVRGRFDGDGRWLAPLASAAEEDGETLRLRIGPSWAAGRVAREVRVSLGPPHDRADSLVMPVAWKAVGLQALFPLLDGDVELAPLGVDRCRLSLSASYAPPLGELGIRLDRALLHRVAESTVRSFLNRVAKSLQERDDDPAPQMPPGDTGAASDSREG